MNKTPRTGRCQHCKQTRPLFKHEGELQYWGYDPTETAWLCAPDWQAREIAVENDRGFAIAHSIKPFDETGTES